MRQRLQKCIAEAGIASRRAAEELLRGGRVCVNGVPAALGESADPETDRITVDGKLLPRAAGMVYLMLNKPRGYVTTLSDEKGRPDAGRLVAGCGVRVFPVGRLDMDSEGLLLFTNDGAFAQHVMHPSGEVCKTYEVYVSGFTREKFSCLSAPMVMDGRQLSFPELSEPRVSDGRASFLMTIHEGRNRQVRRMCGSCGLTVLRLKRIQEGSLKLGNLAPGHWRYLLPEEVAEL